MQTSYSLVPVKAAAGLPGDNMVDSHVENYPASEVIPFGMVVEVVAGKVRIPSSTTLGKSPGVSLRWASAVTPIGGAEGSYQIGEMVPVMRKGKVWAQFSGGTQVAFTAANVNHSSTVATNRGKVSASATSVVAGSEVSAKPGFMFLETSSVSGLALVEVNFPENLGA